MTTPSIDGYEIIGKIGTGGMSTVWKAKQLSLDRIVALKVLNPSLFKSEEYVERFRKEAQAAARLRHPGLAEIYDAGQKDGCVYYVMEYIAGFSVASLIQRKGEVSEQQALNIVSGVATVLGALWEKNQAVHCDIKPDNILIDQDGQTRVTDLGLARFLGSVTAEMDANYIVGTPNYSSPEQARGTEDLDCRTDIYALGSTLYHMLTGVMPFANSDGEAALQRHLSEYVADPLSLNPDVSSGAAMLLEKMMIKDRTLRYADWKELVEDIARVQNGELPVPPWPTSGQSTILRSPDRETHLRKHVATKLPGQRKKIPQTPNRQRTALPSQHKKTSAGPLPPAASKRISASLDPVLQGQKPGLSPLGSTLIVTALLAICVILGYIYVFKQAKQRPPPLAPAPSGPNIISTRTTDDPPAHPSRARDRIPVSPAILENETTAPTTPASPGDWSHPSYDEAMELLRGADKAFQDFLISRNQSLLSRVEPDCRKAIELFESLRAEAPATARIPERVRQANQLIYNARRSQQ